MQQCTLVIPGPLPGLNDYINAERGAQAGRYKAAQLKRKVEAHIGAAITAQLSGMSFTVPVVMLYTWHEPSRRRDKDNIAFAKKFIQDSLVNAGVLENDTWERIDGFADRFLLDKHAPRVEVLIREADGVAHYGDIFAGFADFEAAAR